MSSTRRALSNTERHYMDSPAAAADSPQETTGLIGARLDRLPATRTIWTLVVLISLGGFFEFYELFATAYIAPGIVRSGLLHATSSGFLNFDSIASFIAASFLGLLIGTLMFGTVADRLGRRSVFTLSLLWYTASAAMMAFQTTPLGLNFWRLMVGIGLGVELVTIDSYLSEVVPKHVRGRAFALNQLVTYLAVPVIACLAWRLVPLSPFGIDGWRWVVLTGSIGAVAVWVIRLRVPESPRWLAARGRHQDANAVLDALEERVARESNAALPSPAAATGEIIEQGRLREIFSPPYRSRTIMLCVFHVFQTVGLYGFSNWVPTFLMHQGLEVTASLGYTLGITLVMPCGPLIALWYGDHVERKWQIVGSALLVAVAGLCFAQSRTPGLTVLTGALVTLGATTLSYNFHAYQSELYPTRVRARAIGFVYAWSRLSGIFSGFLIAYALRGGGVSAALFLIAGCMGIDALVVGALGPATRGRSLESISH
ncbi:MFS transporter [Paraburkholderia sp. 22B1P]|uniref:MFS transporter n=1 Tax=Paraburkholderia sp. 22B1P TaxID=3080498 RepID=UPI003086A956|nr:MFS transporter [Paraburkholderia sp. 22B1P]